MFVERSPPGATASWLACWPRAVGIPSEYWSTADPPKAGDAVIRTTAKEIPATLNHVE
jgi:hypothetical protein